MGEGFQSQEESQRSCLTCRAAKSFRLCLLERDVPWDVGWKLDVTWLFWAMQDRTGGAERGSGARAGGNGTRAAAIPQLPPPLCSKVQRAFNSGGSGSPYLLPGSASHWGCAWVRLGKSTG